MHRQGKRVQHSFFLISERLEWTKEGIMGHAQHSREEIEAKLREMHPEINEHGLGLQAEFSHDKDAWIVHLTKGEHELTTHLDRSDANACLEGVECVHLGVQIGQFVSNFES